MYGCLLDSGPSLYEPVTGTPACWGYFAARKKTPLVETMPKAPLESVAWTAVMTAVGLVWSSITSGNNLWPFTPPSAFWRSMRASKPEGEEE